VVITDTNKTGLLIRLTVIGIVTFAETPPQTVNYHTTPMTKRQEQYLAWRKELDKCGWDVSKVDSVQFNSGSETLHHLLAKTATAYILKQNGYRVDSEVEHPERGTVDICSVPCVEDRKPFVVELEHSPTQATIEDKLQRYYHGTPFAECYVINLNRVPMQSLEMVDHIAGELGLDI